MNLLAFTYLFPPRVTIALILASTLLLFAGYLITRWFTQVRRVPRPPENWTAKTNPRGICPHCRSINTVSRYLVQGTCQQCDDCDYIFNANDRP